LPVLADDFTFAKQRKRPVSPEQAEVMTSSGALPSSSVAVCSSIAHEGISPTATPIAILETRLNLAMFVAKRPVLRM
jgi:hypothetical protein